MTQKPIKATLDSSDDSVKTQKPILIQLDDIPTPTDADAGKVLGVDEDGKYALTEGGGGATEFLITIMLSSMGDDVTATFDKTYEEIKTAYDAGKPLAFCIVVDSGFDFNVYGYSHMYAFNPGKGSFILPRFAVQYVNDISGVPNYVSIAILNDDTTSVTIVALQS